MKRTITVRNKVIGSGIPIIIVPIVESTKSDILDKAKQLCELNIDAVEWRMDFYKNSDDISSSIDVLNDLRLVLGDKILLVTLRTLAEGGEKPVTKEQYIKTIKSIAESRNADLIDSEMFFGDDVAEECIKAIHDAGSIVVGSYHDFEKTPCREDILSCIKKIQDMGADIPKIAVMPKSDADVLTLISAAVEMKEKYANRPMYAVSMGPRGVVTRIAAEMLGSCMSFGSVGMISTPGQIPVEELITAQRIYHNSL